MFVRTSLCLFVLFLYSCGEYKRPYVEDQPGLVLEAEVEALPLPASEQVRLAGFFEYNLLLTSPVTRYSPAPPRSYKAKVLVVRLGVALDDGNVLHEFQKFRYRPATIYELLALSRSGKAPLSGSVVALDKLVVKDHGEYYPYLDSYLSEETGDIGSKNLRLKRVRETFRPSCMFAVVLY